MKMKYTLTALLLASLAILSACKMTESSRSQAGGNAPRVALASFNPDGTVNRPQNHRQWVHVGTAMLPKGSVNIIDDKMMEHDEYIKTYVEPGAYSGYMKTGVWPEGSQFVKEFAIVQGVGADGITTESHYGGLALIVKDSTKYPKETGNLGYFNFGHHREPYENTSKLMTRTKCSACHEANASNQQYIFSSRHIGLARPQN